MFYYGVRGNTAAERWALNRRREFDRRLSALVPAAIDQGDVRADLDPALLTRLLFGMVNGVAESCRPNGAHRSSAVADTLVRLAFNGLRRPG